MATTVLGPIRSTSFSAAARYVAALLELADYYHERGLENEDVSLVEVRFAASLARYRQSPPPGKMIAERMHVMIFGGAGAGKSTVANILVGAEVAEVNAQAGYTRHPVAYCRSDTQDADLLWPERLGSLARDDGAASAHVHRDCFGWQNLPADLADPGFFRRHVVWDGPDLTAKDATYYESRVVEIAALADVCVYVASDERYNDELPTNFLQTMLDAGKWVVVALTKVGEEDADEFVRLFRTQVVARLRNSDRLLAVVPIPAPADGDVAGLWSRSSSVGSALRDAIERATGDFADARHSGRTTAGAYLKQQQGRLLAPLRKDLGEWQAWMEIVRKAANEAVRRYEREYLVAARYPELADALEGVLGGFALSGKLRHFGRAMDLLRTPWRLLKGLWQRFAPTRVESAVEEERVLERLRQGMLESVQVACSAWRSRHSLWRALHEAIQHEAPGVIEPAYAAIRDRRERELKQRLLATARSVQEGFWKSPLTSHGLHVARVLLDALAILAAVYIPLQLGAYLLVVVLVPLFVGLVDELVRLACRVYVERHRAGLIRQQKESVRELVRTAYIEPLLRLPKSQGSRFVGLSRLAETIPALLDETMAASAIDQLPSE